MTKKVYVGNLPYTTEDNWQFVSQVDRWSCQHHYGSRHRTLEGLRFVSMNGKDGDKAIACPTALILALALTVNRRGNVKKKVLNRNYRQLHPE
jgi:hypothetical protein